MYDELVKRLRVLAKDQMFDFERQPYLQAADAIEERSQQVDKFMQEAARLNAKLPRWIPVTERLPEEGVSVQVCFRSQGGIAQAVSERFVNDRNQSYWSGLWMKPTHWMPLPEPPKEET